MLREFSNSLQHKGVSVSASNQLTQRLFSIGATTPLGFLEKFMPAIRSWLFEVIRDNVPSKEQVLQWVGEALDQVLESTEFPIADDLLDAAIKDAIVKLAGVLYDQLVELRPGS